MVEPTQLPCCVYSTQQVINVKLPTAISIYVVKNQTVTNGLSGNFAKIRHPPAYHRLQHDSVRNRKTDLDRNGSQRTPLQLVRKDKEECGAHVIAVAHHQDDSVETMLFNLIRGTGITGLLGIRPRNGAIVRPLLCINREEIIRYLQQIGQDFVTDSTNLEDEYTRNKIRLNLLPLMQEINPSVKNSLIETSNHLNDVATIYNKVIDEAKTRIITPEGIRIDALLDEPAPEAFLFETLHPLGFNSAQIKDIANSLHGQPGKQFVSKEWRVIKDRNLLLLETIRPEDESTFPYQLIKEEREFTPDFRIPREKETACFDADKLNEEIHCRKWQAGDTFIPFGMTGKKKISDYLTDRKFSISQKERQWVLCCGERIAWLIGERTDNRFRIDETTKRVIIYKIV